MKNMLDEYRKNMNKPYNKIRRKLNKDLKEKLLASQEKNKDE